MLEAVANRTMDTSPLPLEALGQAVLDGLRQPVLAVDGCRRIALRNARARSLLEEGKLFCEYAGNRLHACDAHDDGVLQAALEEIAMGRRGRCAARLLSPLAGGTELHLRALSCNGSGRLALVAIFERRSVEQDALDLGATFGLTPAEARVAGYLAQGITPKEVAATCGVSLCTVRTQIRTVFAKTGVRRQSDLVRLLLTASLF